MMTETSADNSIRDRLLERIALTDNSPAQLAADMNIDLADLSRWIMHGENLRLVEGIARLSDVRAQMILSRYRANAALHLVNIAGESKTDESKTGEVSRKACVDLLTTNLPVFEADACAPAAAPPAPNSETILEVLERLGAQADARNSEDPPPNPPAK
jgi:hypothetical protein